MGFLETIGTNVYYYLALLIIVAIFYMFLIADQELKRNISGYLPLVLVGSSFAFSPL